MKRIGLNIIGMSCKDCISKVKEALKAVNGVTDINLNPEKAMAWLNAPSGVSPDEVVRAVENAGYQATVLTEADVPLAAPKQRQEIVIIGGGSAGFAAAIKAWELGARVTIIEHSTIGGTCVNIGCVPTKTLIRAAQTYYQSFHHNFDGIDAHPGPLDFKKVIDQKDSLVSTLRREKYEKVLDSYKGMRYIKGHALVKRDSKDRITVDAGRETLRPDKLIIATGAHPWIPPIKGLDKTKYLTSTEALALEKVPRELIIIGGSALGLEFAQIFSRFGSKVYVIEAIPYVLPPEGEEVGNAIAGYLGQEGIEFFTGAKINMVRYNGEYRIDFKMNGKSHSINAEQLLVATGRRANTGGFGIEESGIRIGKKGEIEVNQYLQTSHPDVYAAGDVIGDPMFVYVAALAGTTAAENALSGNRQVFDLSVLPRVTFTDPQVASVGLTAEQAKSQGIDYKSSRLDMKHVPRALAARDTRGFVRLVAEMDTGRLLGAQIVSPDAGEMIMEATLSIKYNITISELAAQIHPYLTLSEGIKLAAQSFDRDVSRLSCCSA
ncbi:MAG: mercury(II) reductase [Nitrospirota bacterium]|nr:mercury(II) reductase [Nitrospirota bacterium]